MFWLLEYWSQFINTKVKLPFINCEWLTYKSVTWIIQVSKKSKPDQLQESSDDCCWDNCLKIQVKELLFLRGFSEITYSMNLQMIGSKVHQFFERLSFRGFFFFFFSPEFKNAKRNLLQPFLQILKCLCILWIGSLSYTFIC